jgi:hypothetical protein
MDGNINQDPNAKRNASIWRGAIKTLHSTESAFAKTIADTAFNLKRDFQEGKRLANEAVTDFKKDVEQGKAIVDKCLSANKLRRQSRLACGA